MTDAIRVVSPRYGTYDVPEDRVVELSEGLVGLPEARRFALLESNHPDSPFRYLLCVDDPELAFLVCDPEPFFPGYVASLPRAAQLGPDSVVLAIVTVPDDPHAMTANLMAPLVFDGATRRGRQLIIEGATYGTRHRLLPD